MAYTIVPQYVATKADPNDTSVIGTTKWNQTRQLTGGVTGDILTYDSAQTSRLNGVAAVAVGRKLVSAGVGVSPVWFACEASTSSQFDVTGTVALANVTGLSVGLSSQQTYGFEATVYTTSSSASGVKFAISGTATATSIIYEAIVTDGTSISAHTRASSLGTAVGGINTVTAAYARISGTIVVNAAGTLTVQFAQNSSTVGTSSVLVGSRLSVDWIK